MQCGAVCCGGWFIGNHWHIDDSIGVAVSCSALQCVVVCSLCCTVLHCVAVCCSVLQCVAVHIDDYTCVAVCCSK